MKQKKFIDEIVPHVQKFCTMYGYGIVSAIVAQACIESRYGESNLAKKYHNYFGMKAGSWKTNVVSLVTKEEYKKGVLVKVTAKFRTYDTLADGVQGYFDFIKSAHYKKARACTTCEQYLQALKDAGYATASNYVKSCMAVVQKYNLTQYDTNNVCPYAEPKTPVKAGQRGNGVLWLQWHLNVLISRGIINATTLQLDDSFGPKTLYVFTKFQSLYPDSGTKGKPDGSCGTRSRNILKSLTCQTN